MRRDGFDTEYTNRDTRTKSILFATLEFISLLAHHHHHQHHPFNRRICESAHKVYLHHLSSSSMCVCVCVLTFLSLSQHMPYQHRTIKILSIYYTCDCWLVAVYGWLVGWLVSPDHMPSTQYYFQYIVV